jgi:hypothetical protein
MAKTIAPGYVYLIRVFQRSPFANTRLYKIGASKNPFKRLKELSSGPSQLSVIAIVPTWDMYGLEARLHDRFSKWRIKGEWFALSEKNIKLFNRITARAVTKRTIIEPIEKPQPVVRLVKKVG